MIVRRTQLQQQADAADLELYRVISRLERMHEAYPKARQSIRSALQKVRAARSPVRELMHEYDRCITI